MKYNYHTHTFRCHHAAGKERDYIENAIRAGMKELGFSDHAPQFFPGDYYSNFRMRPEELEDYVSTLDALRREYKDDITIRIGLEAEYYPAYFPALLPFVRQCGVEYLILGQHFLGNEIGAPYSGAPTEDERILAQYTSQVLEGLRTGCFSYLAHPDLVRFTGDDAVYRRHIEPFCRAVKELDIPLEINFLGIMDHRHYPCGKFFSIAAEVGNRFVLGMDAHQPEVILNQPLEAEARAFCRRLGITPEETPSLIHPVL